MILGRTFDAWVPSGSSGRGLCRFGIGSGHEEPSWREVGSESPDVRTDAPGCQGVALCRDCAGPVLLEALLRSPGRLADGEVPADVAAEMSVLADHDDAVRPLLGTAHRTSWNRTRLAVILRPPPE